MVKLNTIYNWEVETVKGEILPQYNDDGAENSWKVFDPDQIIRFSFIPTIEIFPRHDVFIDVEKGDRFIKRFGRGFLTQKSGFSLSEYLNCVVTNRYRFYIFSSNGRTLLTHKDYELYV